MPAPTKTAGTNLLTIQQIASNGQLLSSAIGVSGKFSITVYVWIGRDDTAGALAAPATIRVQGSPEASGDRYWQDLQIVKTGVTVPESEAVSGTEAAAQTVISVASTTNLVVEGLVLFKNTTIGNSEFAQIVAIASNVSITIRDGLTNAQTGSTIYNQAEEWVFSFDLVSLSIQRIRLVIDASGTGRTIVAEARYTTTDAIT